LTVVAVIGSRGFPDPEPYIEIALRGLGKGDGLVSGGARNVDQKAEKTARDRGLTVVSFRPVKAGGTFFIERFDDGQTRGLIGNPLPLRFPTFGLAAFERNWMIANLAEDGVTALWDGASTGTAHGIACAIRHGRAVKIWMPGDS
jgi:hypothetical protein